MIRRDRRKRIRRPFTLVILSLFLILEPLIQLIGLSIWKNVSVRMILKDMSLFQSILFFFPMLPGLGLYLVKKWGWFLFIGYSIFLIFFNLFAVFKNPSNYNYHALIETILISIMIIYFLRKDISPPYFKMYPRGWRGNKRTPVNKNVCINGIWTVTKDISETGFYAEWNGEEYSLGKELTIIFEDFPELKQIAGVVRIDKNGIGLGFRR